MDPATGTITIISTDSLDADGDGLAVYNANGQAVVVRRTGARRVGRWEHVTYEVRLDEVEPKRLPLAQVPH